MVSDGSTRYQSKKKWLTGSSDPVDIILYGQRESIINDGSNVRNIQSPSCHISCHKQPRFASLEFLQSVHTCGLRHVTMECTNRVSMLAKCGFNSRCLFLIECKDKDASFGRPFGGLFLVRESFQRFRQMRAGEAVSIFKVPRNVQDDARTLFPEDRQIPL